MPFINIVPVSRAKPRHCNYLIWTLGSRSNYALIHPTHWHYELNLLNAGSLSLDKRFHFQWISVLKKKKKTGNRSVNVFIDVIDAGSLIIIFTEPLKTSNHFHCKGFLNDFALFTFNIFLVISNSCLTNIWNSGKLLRAITSVLISGTVCFLGHNVVLWSFQIFTSSEH